MVVLSQPASSPTNQYVVVCFVFGGGERGKSNIVVRGSGRLVGVKRKLSLLPGCCLADCRFVHE